MKKYLMTALALIMASAICFAQEDQRDIRNERQEIRKLAKKELTDRVDKATRKEAKRLTKEGWLVKPGALPLAKQLEKSYLMQFEYDENLFPKYIMADASSLGENYDAAKVAALELAKTNLAGQIQTEVAALVENRVANKQLSSEEAASITQSVMANKNIIAQSIGRVVPVVECYRINDKKNNEVLVRLAYNSEMAKEAVKQAVRDQLADQSEQLQKKLDSLLGI
ncbi:MAG: hypothetical protein ACI395_04240 [Candidatus Cryptobacteroides sp.]